MKNKINILIVDDSPTIQKLFTHYLALEEDFNIVGCCSNPFEALTELENSNIDIMILDLEMPKMDGYTFLKKINGAFKTSTIVVSTISEENSTLKQKLIEAGAKAVLTKPDSDRDLFFNNLKKVIRTSSPGFFQAPNISLQKTQSPEALNPIYHFSELILIASSTGGTQGIKKIISSLDQNIPAGLVIIQHMGAAFTNKFAKSLNAENKCLVKEAEDNDRLQNGMVFIAKGGTHLEIKKVPNKPFKFLLENNLKPPVHSVRPAADVTFINLPKDLASKTTVIILSGMGQDGAAGLMHLKQLGAHTIAESEKSCTVFGMPKKAIETGCVDQVLTIDEICDYLKLKLNGRSKAAG